ncbi:MAG: class I SAM-dependent rRNA methyltransferase, partial [Rudaea sp.]
MNRPEAVVRLKPDREKKILNYYPWVYQQEIESIEREASAGGIVLVSSARGQFLGRAFYNPSSHIPLRFLTFDPELKIGRAFFEERIAQAIRRREGRMGDTNAYRVFYAEADGIPGLVVDRFGPVLVVQMRNPGIARWREELIRSLKRLLTPSGIYERSDTQAVEEEAMEQQVGLLWGDVPDSLDIAEDGLHFQVNVLGGQKTGFYLDQRDNRRMLESLVKPGEQVLDVYAYTGAFSMHAARAGAKCLAVDKDADALRLLELNARRNGFEGRIGARIGDAVDVMTHLRDESREFDHIVLDPPTLAKHKNDVARAKQLFTEITGAALALLKPSGTLFLSTCAYHVSANDLVESSRMAAADLRRRLRVVTITYQPPDHPWILQVPETLY